MRKTALAFLAHPDDAEFLCAGTLILLAEKGWELHIVTATAGDLGSMTEDPARISGRRTIEATQAAALIGADYHCLGELDCRVCYDQLTLQKIFDVFRQIAPSLVFTHSSRDYMLDHEIVSQLARAASFSYSIPFASEYPRHPKSCIPYLYYCDPIEGVDPLGYPVQPTTWVNITSALPRKADMLACHVSQCEWLSKHHGMDEYLATMKRHAFMRGNEISVTAAEAFVQHRGHSYPSNDILAELFPHKNHNVLLNWKSERHPN